MITLPGQTQVKRTEERTLNSQNFTPYLDDGDGDVDDDDADDYDDDDVEKW